MKQRKALRRLLQEKDLVVAPVCVSPMTARVVEQCGFQVAYLGGYALGCTTCITEPLTNMVELASDASRIARRISLPLIVDGNAGFGEPMHTRRMIEELIWSGIAGAHIEDQHFPKRAHYHRDYIEHTTTLTDLVQKISMAHQARQELDPDFLIIGRTDAIRTDGYDEGVHRATAMLTAGADMVMLFPDDEAQARSLPRDVPGPVVYVNSLGNRIGRPVFANEELADLGYKMVIDAMTGLLLSYKTARDSYQHFAKTGESALAQEEAVELRKELEDLIGMEAYYQMEEQTVEPPPA
ncbi:MAG: isocitrate lyase/PEP mutase family protein [Nitrospiraceae bacterium]|nr:isocitrate lyase/PEP mutase family protein [Nitrospiraceae bacterium]